MVRQLWHIRQLLWQFTLREVQGRYRGSYLGMVWALVTPVAMLLVYTFVFHNIFGARWDRQDEPFIHYAMQMFSGIIAFNIFAESAGRASLLIVQNPNFVKKVVFPLEMLPLSLVGSALIHSLLSLSILLVGLATGEQSMHWTLILLPLALLPLVIFTSGVCWILSSLGVFLRDIGNIVTVLLQLLFFLTPVTYPMSRLSPRARDIMNLNPLTSMIDNFRLVLSEGKLPHWRSWSVGMLFSLLVATIGYAWFMKIKRAFADVL